ncbi:MULTISPECIES: hypothetical protein [Citrobacter]|jgi:hypothetical protein|uniref:hypothetical protein n=1 Tax=Citrobacter TaxID=544 RepID=UPI0012FE7512|nr:hypothetical protein [Citrobacter sp. Ce104]MBJ9266225.1 hypothetical protein [Citrobacter freundii]MDM3278717.1 hypothetical protein [Citrobacter sp. Ce104]
MKLDKSNPGSLCKNLHWQILKPTEYQEKKSRKNSNVCGLQCSNENQKNKSGRHIRKPLSPTGFC